MHVIGQVKIRGKSGHLADLARRGQIVLLSAFKKHEFHLIKARAQESGC